MKILFVLALSLCSLFVAAQESALIIVDVQEFYFEGGASELVNPIPAAKNAARLIEACRGKGIPVIHVKHKFEPGGDIHPLVAPAGGERVFTKSQVNAFVGTDLKLYLDSLDVKRVIICGMQTHMCVEAAVRASADFGYQVVLVHDACATKNVTWETVEVPAAMVHASTLGTLRNYAKILSTNEFLESIQ